MICVASKGQNQMIDLRAAEGVIMDATQVRTACATPVLATGNRGPNEQQLCSAAVLHKDLRG
jgi:hypothetical protein